MGPPHKSTVAGTGVPAVSLGESSAEELGVRSVTRVSYPFDRRRQVVRALEKSRLGAAAGRSSAARTRR
jgi:hypothetical protein